MGVDFTAGTTPTSTTVGNMLTTWSDNIDSMDSLTQATTARKKHATLLAVSTIIQKRKDDQPVDFMEIRKLIETHLEDPPAPHFQFADATSEEEYFENLS